MTIKPYKKKDGKTYYELFFYRGIDEKTGKKKFVHRRGFKTKKEAEQAMYLLSKNAPVVQTSKQKLTFKDVYREWMQQYQKTVKESTLQKTRTIFTIHILPIFESYLIRKIDLQDVQKFIDDLSKNYANFSTVKSYLNRVFIYAMKKEYIQKNPCDLITLPKRNRSTEDLKQNFYDKEELKEFLKLAKEKNFVWYAFFRLLAFSGIRKGEALALNWSDIENNRLSISKTLTNGLDNSLIIQSPKTKKSTRYIDLDAKTISVLKKHKQEQTMILGNQKLVFPNEKGSYFVLSKPNHFLESFYKQYPDIKKITTHGFRHTHCSLLFEAGLSLKEVQDRLGHSDIHTTMNIYAHVSKYKKQEALDKFIKYINF